jgi:hypothetical protein
MKRGRKLAVAVGLLLCDPIACSAACYCRCLLCAAALAVVCLSCRILSCQVAARGSSSVLQVTRQLAAVAHGEAAQQQQQQLQEQAAVLVGPPAVISSREARMKQHGASRRPR